MKRIFFNLKKKDRTSRTKFSTSKPAAVFIRPFTSSQIDDGH
jgi:hypothetical protein